MTNDINTLNGALQELGETLADNLVAMGVTDAEASDGLTTLAGKVLDITPALTGIELSTNLSCDSSIDIIDIDETTDIIGVLTASYDDTSQSNVDLTGFLQGANIKIYEDDTLIDTVTTNNKGEYTSTYLPSKTGNVTIHTAFEGTEDYDSCTSNNKTITVDELLKYGFDGTTPFVAFSGRNTTYTTLSNNQLTQISGSKGGCHSKTTIFETEADYTISFKIVESTLTVSNGIRIGIHSANYSDHHERACLGIGYTGDSTLNKVTFDYSDTTVTTVTKDTTTLTSLNVGDVIKFVVIDDTFSAYINDTFYTSATLDWLHDPIWLYAQSWGTGTASMTITNFKVQQHKDSLTLSADKDVLSYSDNDTAILTATYKEEGIRTANKSIIFKNGDTVLDTITTDNNGEAEYTYTATGDGDVTITANYSNLNSNILIEDCIYWNSNEISYTSSSTIVENAIINNLFDINTQNFVMEFDIKGYGGAGGLNIGATAQYNPPSNANYRIFIGLDTNKFSLNNRTTSSSNSTVGYFTNNTYYHMKLVKSGISFTGYYGDNDTSIATKTANWISNYSSWCLYWINWNNTNYVKNIKIKVT